VFCGLTAADDDAGQYDKLEAARRDNSTSEGRPKAKHGHAEMDKHTGDARCGTQSTIKLPENRRDGDCGGETGSRSE
jgi:hypothetical protein